MKSKILDTPTRKELINNIKKLKLHNEVKLSAHNINDKLFKFEDEKKVVDYNINNIIDNGLEKLLVECYNEKNSTNFVFFSIFGRKEDTYNYISTIFEENPKLKDDNLYILFMIKSGKITQLIKEKKEFLYNNFYSIFLLLIQNYDYFDDINVNLFFEQLLRAESKYVIYLFIIIRNLLKKY
jgi:hypothetical protein